jgi:hypothetical protein
VAYDVADEERSRAGRTASVHPELAESLRLVLTSLPIVLFATDRDGIFTLSEGRGLAGLPGRQPPRLASLVGSLSQLATSRPSVFAQRLKNAQLPL